jgi:integrase
MGNLISFMKKVADGLRESGNYGTAHIYRSSMSAILAFNESGNLPFRKVTPEFLKSFEAYLRGRNCSWNTVSTYMRTLRAVYNRAVDRRIAPYVPHHFRYVYTGTRADKKRALEKEDMERLMKDIPKQLHSGNRELQRARGFFILMFLLRGMPFVDLAYLKKHDIDGNVLTYRRRKTGRMLTVTLLPEAVKLIKQHMNTDPASPYLFSLISSKEGTDLFDDLHIGRKIALILSASHVLGVAAFQDHIVILYDPHLVLHAHVHDPPLGMGDHNVLNSCVPGCLHYDEGFLR